MAIRSKLSVAAALALLAAPALADPLAQPSMGATLAGAANPFSLAAGPLGKVYVSGVVSGLGLVQDNHSPFDRSNLADLANGQVFIQTTSGPVQFFIDAGVYALPALGTAYVHATTNTSATYSGLPMAYLKLQPTPELSIQIGKLPTLIGAEAAYTFQNINIERGLLWNQEPVFSDGVQVNYAKGKIALSVSLNDGFYSNRYNWLSGSAAYTLSAKDSLTVSGGASLSRYDRQTTATPVLLNNGGLVDLIYTHTEGPWMISPYLQYTHSEPIHALGQDFAGADTWGAAVLGKVSFNAHWSLAGRAEYIASSSAACPPGDPLCARTSLLYGPGSKALSLTLTPTFQQGAFFARAEASWVDVFSGASGAMFGQLGDARSQVRGLIETGFVF
jgi:hypothetical protein